MVDSFETYNLGKILNIELVDDGIALNSANSRLSICSKITFHISTDVNVSVSLDDLCSRQRAVELMGGLIKNTEITIEITGVSLNAYKSKNKIFKNYIFRCFYEHSSTIVAEISSGSDFYSTVP